VQACRSVPDSWRKPALPSNTHDTGQCPRTPPLAAPKSSPARPPSSLAPSRPRPRRACRAPLANGWEPRLGARVAPGVPIWHRGAPRPPEQGRCALHQARCRGAHRAGPWAAARAGAGSLQGGAAKRPGTVRNLWQPIRAAQAPGASTARGHIYLAPGTPVAVVVRARRTPQSPPVRYTSTAISANFQEPEFRFYPFY
jgi:hypothetical protein